MNDDATVVESREEVTVHAELVSIRGAFFEVLLESLEVRQHVDGEEARCRSLLGVARGLCRGSAWQLRGRAGRRCRGRRHLFLIAAHCCAEHRDARKSRTETNQT